GSREVPHLLAREGIHRADEAAGLVSIEQGSQLILRLLRRCAAAVPAVAGGPQRIVIRSEDATAVGHARVEEFGDRVVGRRRPIGTATARRTHCYAFLRRDRPWIDN